MGCESLQQVGDSVKVAVLILGVVNIALLYAIVLIPFLQG